MAPSLHRVVLVWDADDLQHIDGADWVVPLTADAVIAARQRQVEIVDAQTFIGRDPPIEPAARDILNELHHRLRSSPQPSWLEAYANVVFGTSVFQFATWLRLLRRLQIEVSPARLEVRIPQAFSTGALEHEHDSFGFGLASKSLVLACEVVRREGVSVLGRKRRPRAVLRQLARRNVARLAGWCLPVCERLVSQVARRRVSSLATRQADVILVSQQYGDAWHAVPLAAHLARVYERRFAWIGIRPAPARNITTEESSFFADVQLEEFDFVDSAVLYEQAKRGGWRAASLDLGGAWRVSGVLLQIGSLSVARRDWFECLTMSEFRGLGFRFKLWQQFLDLTRPAVVVGLSTLQDMALVRAWARLRQVPFVSLMHGAYPGFWRSHDVDADYLGVFGSLLSAYVTSTLLPRPPHVVACGTMQFGEKIRHAIEWRADSDSDTQRGVLLLTSFESLPFCPIPLEIQCRVLRDIHRACLETGKFLRVRTHPRFPAASWAALVNELRREHPGTIALSVEQSLSADVADADIAIVSSFDGATVDALLSGIPVLSYLPADAAHTESTELLEETGGLVRNYETLRDALSDSPRAERRLRLGMAQRMFLSRYFEGIDDPPWDRAIALIAQALADTSTAGSKAVPPHDPERSYKVPTVATSGR